MVMFDAPHTEILLSLATNQPTRTSKAITRDVVVYTRQGCHLCDVACETLRRYGLSPELVDIDQSEELRTLYTEWVPVVVINGRVRFRGRIDERLLRRILANE